MGSLDPSQDLQDVPMTVQLQAYLLELMGKFKIHALACFGLLSEFWQRLGKSILPKLRTEL